tara:strand:+ start:1405 stop:2175 length:771 start_codon:yes stop_codon:yes gene_type:complete
VQTLCDDLVAETDALTDIVKEFSNEQWLQPTVAEGWDTLETILHLGATDLACYMAVDDPVAFGSLRERLAKGEISVHDAPGIEVREKSGPKLWEWFIEGRTQMVEALRKLDPKQRIVWLGPEIGALSLATSRLLETWTHSHDIADTFGRSYPQTDRLRHIAHIGFVTRAFSYVNRGLAAPSEPVRVELDAPSGETWVWGPEESANSVTGSAYEFCKVVTRRTPVAESRLEIQGELAWQWMEIAQPWIEPPRISDQA